MSGQTTGSPTITSREAALPASAGRLDSIDLYRGLIMVIMLLDHTRDYVHAGAFLYDPLDLSRTTPWLYATRWITHLCAPGFVFLAGVSAGLQALRGTSARDLSRFLWTRGLWLVFLELFVVRTIVWFNLYPSLLAQLQVIWAIGVSMLVLAALVRLPRWVIATVGFGIVLGHNALDTVQVAPWTGPDSPVPSAAAKVWMLLHQGGVFPIAGFPSPIVVAMYPVLPWIGVMAVGYVAAGLWHGDADRRRARLAWLAVGMVAAFVALRTFNIYGDNQPWAFQGAAVQSAMSFMNVQKYPPSLLFLFATLAPCLLALAYLDRRQATSGLSRAFVTFGRVPLFFYLLQWLWAHLGGIVVTAARGLSVAPYFMNAVDIFTLPTPPDVGGPLWMVYVVWLSGAIALYFPCRWYAGVKARRRDLAILRYL